MNKKSDISIISLPVEGMTCARCVARVEKALGKVEGISEVNVNLATEKATLKVNLDKINFLEIQQVIEEAGYKIDLSSVKKNNKDLPEFSTGKEIKSTYEIELKKDFLLALTLTIPVFLISMASMSESFYELVQLSAQQLNKILLILTSPIMFLPGKRFFTIAWKNLKKFQADMNSLVAIGTGAAFLYSLLVTLFPELIGNDSHSNVYFDTSATIITLILMGRWLESRAKGRTNSTIKKLLELKPTLALIKINGDEKEIPIDELQIGDIVIVKSGSRLPADGIVTSGKAFIDESMITGESLPVEKKASSEITGGTINTTGYLEYRVSAIGKNSVLGKIISMVEEAQGSKAPIQRLADKTAAIFVPVVIIIAVITFLFWMFIPESNSLSAALLNFVAVLIIACPCALGLATPTAIIVGTGLAAENGIMIKDAESLESAYKIDTIVFDKTGTITKGKPSVTNFIALEEDEDKIISFAASVERKSEHPFAKAIIDFASERKINFYDVDNFENVLGFGVKGTIEEKIVLIGNVNFQREAGVDISPLKSFMNENDLFSKTIITISVDYKLMGLFIIEDPIKETSIDAIKEIKEMNIKTVMLTGDNYTVAETIAKKVSVDEFKPEILPADKCYFVRNYKKSGKFTAMVGDGINDAPALAESDVGIAIGTGTDVAIETAQIILMNGDLAGVSKAIKISRETIKTIKQNLFWAFIYNVIGIPLAAIGLLNPMFAALAMSLSSVSVVSNSLRLKKIKL
ncbi:MAG: copper-translocating P-type ATPase [Ignavibacteriaceae bacterium]|nr:copper-translocating P-type ATPase [Ignavibacteriaceae bacterium]